MSDKNSGNGGPKDGRPHRPLLRFSHREQGTTDHIFQYIRDYWNQLRGTRSMPSRMEVQPEGVGPALDHAFILERIAPGAARFRLTGHHLIGLMGQEMRGMPICSILNPSSRGRFSDVLETVFRGPQLAEFHLKAPASHGRPEMTGRMLIMPLRSDLGDATRALGCLIAEGTIGVAPRRFDMVRDEVQPLFSHGAVMQPSASAQPEPWRNRREFAEPAADFDHAGISPIERRARFRVVAGGDFSRNPQNDPA